ncbi:MAG: magnesium citrate secondary transporter [Bacteroidia bacterium]|nr:magnesium citrate secondary transporter [Bacteroidia bacterium]
MKSPLSHPLFLVSLGIYLVLFILKKTHHPIPFLSDYGADFLLMPVVMPFAQYVIRLSDPRRREFVFTWHHLLVGWILFSLLFEGLFPALTDRFTRDWWDVLAYVLGGLLFWWVNKKR